MLDTITHDFANFGECASEQLELFTCGPAPKPPTAPDASHVALSRIGHDLRTALNAIMGFSEIMTHKLHGPLGHPKYEEYVKHVRFSGESLLAVSDEVLALAGRKLLHGADARLPPSQSAAWGQI